MSSEVGVELGAACGGPWTGHPGIPVSGATTGFGKEEEYSDITLVLALVSSSRANQVAIGCTGA
jgi:hypothetical protein